MQTCFFPVHSSVAQYVKAIFAFEAAPSTAKEISLPFFADGSPGIVFHQGEADLLWNRNKKMDSLFLYGQSVRPVQLSTRGGFRMITYVLHPHALKVLFGVKAKELTDICIDLSFHPVARLGGIADQLYHENSVKSQLRILNRLVFELAQKAGSSTDPLIRYATEIIGVNKGLVSLDGLVKELSTSHRSFQRKFETEVGVSPKLFSRICQFHASFTQLTTQQYSKLSDIAYDNGYADQSHFIRTFKEFTHYTPHEFLKVSASRA